MSQLVLAADQVLAATPTGGTGEPAAPATPHVLPGAGSRRLDLHV